MTRHVFKLVWNRKRSSAMVFVEIMISFLVLCVVLTAGLQYLRLSREPLGYSYEDRWEVQIGGVSRDHDDDAQILAERRQLREVVRAVRSLPEVVQAAVANNVPFSGSTSTSTISVNGANVRMLASRVEPEFLEALALDLVAGRWFAPDDRAQGWQAVVVTRSLARALFGDDDPLGRDLPLTTDAGEPRQPEDESEIRRVVGVIADYKKSGRFDPAPHGLFQLADLESTEGWIPPTVVVRLRPGTARAFEEKLLATLRSAAPGWSYEIEVLDDRRALTERGKLFPLILGAIVAGFLILMVGLGLVGVLYQNVVRRTSELGLRRALGASGAGVRGQVLGELLALTTVAVGVGAALYLQTPLLDLLSAIPTRVVVEAVVLAALMIYAFVTICGAYPSWLATRVEPAAALQHE